MGESQEVVLDQKTVLEQMATLFYEERKDEAHRAAKRVIKESSSLTMAPDKFIDLVIASGLARVSDTPAEARCQTEQDVTKFIEYFKEEVRASLYASEYLH
jgi:hypothetical protein